MAKAFPKIKKSRQGAFTSWAKKMDSKMHVVRLMQL